MIDLPGPIVSSEWLADHRRDVYIADVRWYLDGRSGRAEYDAGHIPGAVWVDLDRDLAAPPSPAGGRHPLPDPADFAAALGRLGIGEDRPVVAYDDAGGSIAARLWWMLDAIGQPAGVLDGGLEAWPGPLVPDTDTPPATPTTRTPPRPWPAAAIVTTAEVDALRRDPAAVVVDARARSRYEGQTEPVDARPGHIPGAHNHPWTDNLDSSTRRFLPPDELRRRLPAHGEMISSCGSGVTACHNLLALRVAGAGAGGRLYPGSWSAWAADASLPAATGPEPG